MGTKEPAQIKPFKTLVIKRWIVETSDRLNVHSVLS